MRSKLHGKTKKFRLLDAEVRDEVISVGSTKFKIQGWHKILIAFAYQNDIKLLKKSTENGKISDWTVP